MHHGIAGITQSGKTNLAQHLCGEVMARGLYTGVLDPFHNPRWSASFQTADPESFLAELRPMADTGEKWALFIDEPSHALDRYDARFSFLGTGAAQAGIISYFLAQYPMQLAKPIRNSITTWWVFNNSEAPALAKLLGKPILAKATEFPPGSFFLARPFKPTLRGKIIWGKKHGEILRIDLKSA